MKAWKTFCCVLAILATVWLPVFGELSQDDKADLVRAGMAITGAGIAVVGGSALSLRVSLMGLETSTIDAIALALPVAAVGAVTGAMAGRWVADVVLRTAPPPLFAIVEGVGLGLLGGIFVGAATVTTGAVMLLPRLSALLEAGEEPIELGLPAPAALTYTAIALILGAERGAILGSVAGCALVPLVSLYMGF